MADGKTSSLAVSEKPGYCRPPVATRFRKGQSGNPAGRTKGSRNRRRPPPLADDPLRALIREEAYRSIEITENGEEISMPVARAVIRSLVAAATNGDLRAQATFLRLVSGSEMPIAEDDTRAPDTTEPDQMIITIIDPAPPK